MNTIKEIGERLKQQRERLDLSQTQFGAVGGVTKQAQIRYEKGERKPDVLYLVEISKLGIDINQILFGESGQNEALNAQEKEVVSGFRQLSEDRKSWLLSFLHIGVELEPKLSDNRRRADGDKSASSRNTKGVVTSKENMDNATQNTKGGVHVDNNNQGYVADTQHFNN